MQGSRAELGLRRLCRSHFSIMHWHRTGMCPGQMLAPKSSGSVLRAGELKGVAAPVGVMSCRPGICLSLGAAFEMPRSPRCPC